MYATDARLRPSTSLLARLSSGIWMCIIASTREISLQVNDLRKADNGGLLRLRVTVGCRRSLGGTASCLRAARILRACSGRSVGARLRGSACAGQVIECADDVIE